MWWKMLAGWLQFRVAPPHNKLFLTHMLYFTFDRFLIPNDFQAIQFHAIIRKRMNLGKETAITLFVNGKKILTSDSMMSDVYERTKSPDGFLYVTFKEGEHFG